MNSAIHRIWRSAWRPPERRPIYEFAAEHITFGSESPFPGRFRIDNSPAAKTPMDMLRRDDIEQVGLSGIAQSFKSTLASLFITDCIANNPGPATWNSPTKDAAKKTAEKKLWPIFRRCKPIREKLPQKSGFMSIRFPDAPLYVQTASEGNAHGDTVRYQVNDDIHIWLQGILGAMAKRTSAFADGRGRKILNLMTGCTKTAEERLPDGTLIERGDDAFEDWMKGTRSLWNVICPHCRHKQPLVWQHKGKDGRRLKHADGSPVYGIVWETSERTKPGGKWDWKEVAKTARWRCLACTREVFDTRVNRRALNALENGAGYVDTNPHPEPGHWTGRFPGMANELVPWGQLVVEFLFAVECAAVGNLTPLKEFVMNRLADAWFAGESSESEPDASGDYKLGQPWLDDDGKSRVALDKQGKARRYMVIDQQKEGGRHLKVLVREFAEGGASRLVAYYPRIETGEEIEVLRQQHEVIPARVGFDVGDGNDVMENYGLIARYGWTGLRGNPAEGFDHPDPRNIGALIKKAFSRKWYGDPAIGKAKTKGEKRKIHAAAQARAGIRPAGVALCFHWSNPLVKDYLARLRAGQGIYWGRPSNEPEEYREGLFGEQKMEVLGRNGRPFWRWEAVKKNNHPWDLECMALVMAMMSGILAQPEPPPQR